MTSLTTHVRRYPIWYAVGLVWLLAMVSLPIVRGTALADVLDRGGESAGPVTAGGPPPAIVPGVILGPGGFSGGTTDGNIASDPVDDTVVPVEDGDDDDGGDLPLVPPELLDLVFDALPPILLPGLPDEVRPVAEAVAPLAATGCSGIGLAGVVVAVAAQTAEGVPIERLLPYLAPVSTACAAFPIPKVHTVCASDEGFVQDIGGVATSPPPLGLGIDQLAAFEAMLTNSFGVAVPAVSAELREQLDCELVK